MYGSIAAFLVIAEPTSPALEIGLALIAAGQAVRLAAAGHLVKNDVLTRSGPYAHLRDPLYLGTLFILVGFALAGTSGAFPAILVGTVLLPASLAAYFGVYMPRKRRTETERLERRFGSEATEYIAAVPSLVPRLRPARLGPPGEFAIARVFENSEHLTLLAVAAGVAALLAKRAGLLP